STKGSWTLVALCRFRGRSSRCSTGHRVVVENRRERLAAREGICRPEDEGIGLGSRCSRPSIWVRVLVLRGAGPGPRERRSRGAAVRTGGIGRGGHVLLTWWLSGQD